MHFIFILAIALFLASCETSITPPDAAGDSARSNIKTKNGATPFSSTPRVDGPRSIDDDEATQTLINTAERMRNSGDLAGAATLYKRAALNNPSSHDAFSGLAKISEERKDAREALAAWRGILALDNNNVEARRGLARNFMALGLFDKAAKELEKLRKHAGDDVETLNLLGAAYLRDKHYAAAIAALHSALDKEPDNLKTQNNLGYAYIAARDLDKAIAVLEKEIDNPRISAQHRQNLALAYGLAGRENDARALALQDLSAAEVAARLTSYRALRAKMHGEKEPVTEKDREKKKGKQPVGDKVLYLPEHNHPSH